MLSKEAKRNAHDARGTGDHAANVTKRKCKRRAHGKKAQKKRHMRGEVKKKKTPTSHRTGDGDQRTRGKRGKSGAIDGEPSW